MIKSSRLSRWKRFLCPRFIAAKIQENGYVWVGRRALDYMRSLAGLRPKSVAYRFEDKWLGSEPRADVLYAFYDLAISPPTFDIVSFLILAELERRELRCSFLHVVIVPGRNEGFREGDAPYDLEDKRWRLRNVLVPCCWLIPACQHVTVCTSREEALNLLSTLAKRVFPKGYTVQNPIERYLFSHVAAASSISAELPSIQATPQSRRLMKKWLESRAGDRRVITITLRECSYQSDRNSNLNDSLRFARSLDPAVYCPVFIRDIEKASDPVPGDLDGLLMCDAAVWNVELRTALYELSYLNMGVNNGPCILFILNRHCRYLLFKMITPSVGVTTERFLRSIGIVPGSQFPRATPLQRTVWTDDDFYAMKEAFTKISVQLDRELDAVAQR